jgi:hypothetical protein
MANPHWQREEMPTKVIQSWWFSGRGHEYGNTANKCMLILYQIINLKYYKYSYMQGRLVLITLILR